MKTLFSVLFCSILLFSIVSCKKNDDGHNHNNITTPNDSTIVGKWRWDSSVGGVGGVTITPRTDSVIILTIDKAGTFSLALNNQAKVQGNYHKTMPNVDSVLHFDNQPIAGRLYLQKEQRVIRVNRQDLLLFDYMLSDGFNHFFRRQ
jgi:hypothetical protein